MFRITGGKGFHIGFDNGWRISVQFGSFNYCGNREERSDDYQKLDRKLGERGSDDAEIAIFDPADEMLSFGYDTVKGWVQPDEVAFWIFWTRCQDREDTVYDVVPGVLDIDTDTILPGINIKPTPWWDL